MTSGFLLRGVINKAIQQCGPMGDGQVFDFVIIEGRASFRRGSRKVLVYCGKRTVIAVDRGSKKKTK